MQGRAHQSPPPGGSGAWIGAQATKQDKTGLVEAQICPFERWSKVDKIHQQSANIYTNSCFLWCLKVHFVTTYDPKRINNTVATSVQKIAKKKGRWIGVLSHSSLKQSKTKGIMCFTPNESTWIHRPKVRLLLSSYGQAKSRKNICMCSARSQRHSWTSKSKLVCSHSWL